MSVPLARTDPEESTRPPGREAARRRRARLTIAVTVVLLITAVVVVSVRSGGHRHGTATVPTPTGSVPPSGSTGRDRQIRGLLRQRSAAILHHDRRGFLATVDPQSPAFRRSQARMFANLARVHFASWSYRFAATSSHLSSPRLTRYRAPTWVPSSFVLHYRIAGFDRRPTARPQYPTFVRRNGRWYLGSLSDFVSQGKVSATDLWDYAPVHVVRKGRVLVLGPADELANMEQVAAVADAAIPNVDEVWGRHWAQRAVVLVPSTQREMGLIDADRGDLDQIAALTSAEVQSANGRPAPVGDRITINPRNWPDLGPLGQTVVLTHEMTHVATRADTGAQTPKWLAEGFAEYVGFHAVDVSTGLAAADLARRVQAGVVPRRLPTDHAFRGSSRTLSADYQSSWLACRYIADRYGQAALVRFYRAVGTSRLGSGAAVRAALHSVLHLSLARFTARWRTYLREQL